MTTPYPEADFTLFGWRQGARNRFDLDPEAGMEWAGLCGLDHARAVSLRIRRRAKGGRGKK